MASGVHLKGCLARWGPGGASCSIGYKVDGERATDSLDKKVDPLHGPLHAEHKHMLLAVDHGMRHPKLGRARGGMAAGGGASRGGQGWA